MKEYLTVDEAAGWLGMSARYVRRLVEHRRIAFHKMGSSIRIARLDLERFVASTRVEPVDRLTLRRYVREVV